MSLWVDKYRPTRLNKLDFHLDQAKHLKQIVDSGDFPHLLVYGPSGAGKKTRIMAVLRELYGDGVDRLRIESKSFTAPSGKKLEVTCIASNYHIEINPSEVGIYDRVVVQEVIKTMASNEQLDQNQLRNFKVVILTEADRLTRDAQNALRRTMEKYAATCRLILCCQSSSKIGAPLRSRCLGVRVSAPTNEEVKVILHKIIKQEYNSLPDELADRIAAKSDRNLRRAILMMETAHVEHNPLLPDQKVPDLDWEAYLKETAAKIIQEQTPKRLLEVRARLYELISHCVPPEVIFRTLLIELLDSCDAVVKYELVSVAAEYEHRLQLGSKAIFHLEAFVAKFMSIYKRYLEQTMIDFD